MTAIITPILEPPHAKQVILAMAGPSDETAPSIRAFAREIGIPVERTRSVLLWLQQQGLVSYGPGPCQPLGRGVHTYRLTDEGARLQAQMENSQPREANND